MVNENQPLPFNHQRNRRFVTNTSRFRQQLHSTLQAKRDYIDLVKISIHNRLVQAANRSGFTFIYLFIYSFIYLCIYEGY